ncbi:cyclic AMP-dependent transcription factor ATF-1-like [Narcine bancroftii]|uniref:cyclic AMP-dependent transcription factor ATF-1-like n=1 Tax=Narcine bancroftii TaxID=1343680 RepID=UPI0038318192
MELSSGDTASKSKDKMDEEVGGTPLSTVTVPMPVHQTNTGQYFAIAHKETIQLASPGADTLSVIGTGAEEQLMTILQYTQTADGQQILLPSHQVVVQTPEGDMQTYQFHTTPATNLLPQTMVMTSAVTLQQQGAKPQEATRKREIKRTKSRETARECRRKKEEYVKCLENLVVVLENQNKALLEELKALKDMYCHQMV